MKVFVILLALALAAAVGYLMGTEDGRRRRDEMVARLRKETASAAEAAQDAAAEARATVDEAAEKLSA